jgi:hypothetical protein
MDSDNGSKLSDIISRIQDAVQKSQDSINRVMSSTSSSSNASSPTHSDTGAPDDEQLQSSSMTFRTPPPKQEQAPSRQRNSPPGSTSSESSSPSSTSSASPKYPYPVIQPWIQDYKCDAINDQFCALVASPKHFKSSLLLKLEVKRLINIPSTHGFFPLTYAVRFGDLETIRALLDAGANLDVVNPKSGHAALYYAIFEVEKVDVMNLLLAHGAQHDPMAICGQKNYYRAKPPLPLHKKYWLERAAERKMSKIELKNLRRIKLHRLVELHFTLYGQKAAHEFLLDALCLSRVDPEDKPLVLLFAGYVCRNVVYVAIHIAQAHKRTSQNPN